MMHSPLAAAKRAQSAFDERMVTAPIVRMVSLSARRPWLIIALVLALAVGSALYAKHHFAIKTDVNELISHNVPWAKRAAEYMKNFPQWGIIVVVDAPTPEATEQATDKLAHALKARPEQFRAVSQPGGGEFFAKNGLLFLPRDDVAQATEGITRADPLIGTLAADPSLRGVLDALWLALAGVQRGELKLDDMARVMNAGADTAQAAVEGRPASFSWRVLASGKPPEPNEVRRFLLVSPVLDFTALQPGHAATEAIATIASDLKLDRDYQAQVRLTGRIPMEDDEFGTIKHNAVLNVAFTLTAVLVILWLALRSFRIIFACAMSLFAGLAISAAAGLAVVGAFNVISVAFFVLFVGLGVDFGIQFSVRYRAERHDVPDLRAALRSSARKAGGPLALAAVATAVGFASFLPTAYRGLSELGQIAGMGMLIAFATSITLLPALLAVLNPPAEPHPMGFARLAPVDRFLERHRIAVVAGTTAVVLLASPLLLYLPFDFNPLHLRSDKVPSVATYLELAKDPRAGANAIDILEPNLATADATAQKLSALPEVAKATTLSSLVPTDQDEKIKLIAAAGQEIDASLNPEKVEPPPSDADLVDSLTTVGGQLTKIAGSNPGPGADAARRLGGLLARLAQGDAATRALRHGAFRPAQILARSAAQRAQARAGHGRQYSARARRGMGNAERSRAHPGAAQGRSQRHRDPAQLRDRGLRDRAQRHRLRGAALRGGQHRGARVLPVRRVRAVRHRAVAVGDLAPRRRRAAHAGAAGGRGRCHARAVRRARPAAQLRQHHRAAAPPRRRRRVQGLLHHGVAHGKNRAAAIEPDPRGGIFRHDHGDRVRLAVVLEPPGHLEHGQADGARPRVHHGGRRAVPAGADGPAARREGARTRRGR